MSKHDSSVTAADILETLESMRDERQRRILMRFFKTGVGDYGEGDEFLGLRVPQTRLVVREARLKVSLEEIEKLLASVWHEARLCGLLLLVEEMKAALPSSRRDAEETARRREEIVRFYLSHARAANNWDLVDLSAPKILGQWLLTPAPGGLRPDRGVLDRLAASNNLWEQRIAIVSTWKIIRDGDFGDTLRLAEKLLEHPHDLMHKAVGWMLREVGKKSLPVLREFLETHSARMHRTSLRYAIERMSEAERRYWLEKNKPAKR
ncbi:MAG: DNA alkylation repair protein [Alloprevotella sp.]